MRIPLWIAFCALANLSCSLARLTWANTQHVFVFGDSYSTQGTNISTDIKTLNSFSTTSNGPNWIQYLTETYNQTSVEVHNGASAGATIDAALVPPNMPTGQSLVNQVALFSNTLAKKSRDVGWSSSNSLFIVWIGLNDVRDTFAWSNVTSQSAWHQTLLGRMFQQVHTLYDAGARSFLFMTVPPANRAPLFLEQGGDVTSQLSGALNDYNLQLAARVHAFRLTHRDLDLVKLFDTRPVFNALLDNGKTFGYQNTTGYCPAYVNGTDHLNVQKWPCGPAFSYFWLNTLHPIFSVHSILAQAVAASLTS